MFDKNRDKKISLEELQDVLEHCKIEVSRRDVKDVFEMIDLNGDGKIIYEEFCSVMEGTKSVNFKEFVRRRLDPKAKALQEKKDDQPEMMKELKREGLMKGPEKEQIKDLEERKGQPLTERSEAL